MSIGRDERKGAVVSCSFVIALLYIPAYTGAISDCEGKLKYYRYYSAMQTTWTGAVTACKQSAFPAAELGGLATIRSDEENAKVMQLGIFESDPFDWTWIGGRRLNGAKDWRWVSSTGANAPFYAVETNSLLGLQTLNKWYPGEPSHYAHLSQHEQAAGYFMALMNALSSLAWAAYPAGGGFRTATKRYLCQYCPFENAEALGRKENCPSEVKRYVLVSTPTLGWGDAQLGCKASAAGTDQWGNLASIRTAAEQSKIEALGGTADTWIAATDAAVEGEWRWIDDNTLFYRHPDGGGPIPSGYFDGQLEKWYPSEAASSEPNDQVLKAGTMGSQLADGGGDYAHVNRDYHRQSYNWSDSYRMVKPMAYICQYCPVVPSNTVISGVTALCDSSNRVLIQRYAESNCDPSQYTWATSLPKDGCGYLRESAVRKIAARATKVTLEASVEGVGVQSLESDSPDATEALRTGGHWQKDTVVWKRVYVEGQRIEYGDPNGGWYPGKILSVNGDGTYGVVLDDRRYGTHGSSSIRPVPMCDPPTNYSGVGSVEVRESNIWYDSGTVEGVSGQRMYDVVYHTVRTSNGWDSSSEATATLEPNRDSMRPRPWLFDTGGGTAVTAAAEGMSWSFDIPYHSTGCSSSQWPDMYDGCGRDEAMRWAVTSNGFIHGPRKSRHGDMRGLTSSSTWVTVPADVCEMTAHPPESCSAELKHYRYFSGPVGWVDAKVACEASTFLGRRGGFATIRSAEEQVMVQRFGFVTDTMIGGTDEAEEGKWRWVGDNALFWDNTALDYNNFYRGTYNEPEAGGPDHLYVLRATYGGRSYNVADLYKWGDFEALADYLCEYCVADAVLEMNLAEEGLAPHFDRRGRVLIQRASMHAFDKLGCVYGEVSELPLDGCGYLSQASVVKLSKYATAVTLVELGKGEVVSTTDTAVEKLRTAGANWHDSEVLNAWSNPSGWCWNVRSDCDVTGLSVNDGWPNMYHSCNRGECVHWITASIDSIPTVPASRYRPISELAGSGFQSSETWLTLPPESTPTLSESIAGTASFSMSISGSRSASNAATFSTTGTYSLTATQSLSDSGSQSHEDAEESPSSTTFVPTPVTSAVSIASLMSGSPFGIISAQRFGNLARDCEPAVDVDPRFDIAPVRLRVGVSFARFYSGGIIFLLCLMVGVPLLHLLGALLYARVCSQRRYLRVIQLSRVTTVLMLVVIIVAEPLGHLAAVSISEGSGLDRALGTTALLLYVIGCASSFTLVLKLYFIPKLHWLADTDNYKQKGQGQQQQQQQQQPLWSRIIRRYFFPRGEWRVEGVDVECLLVLCSSSSLSSSSAVPPPPVLLSLQSASLESASLNAAKCGGGGGDGFLCDLLLDDDGDVSSGDDDGDEGGGDDTAAANKLRLQKEKAGRSSTGLDLDSSSTPATPPIITTKDSKQPHPPTKNGGEGIVVVGQKRRSATVPAPSPDPLSHCNSSSSNNVTLTLLSLGAPIFVDFTDTFHAFAALDTGIALLLGVSEGLVSVIGCVPSVGFAALLLLLHATVVVLLQPFLIPCDRLLNLTISPLMAVAGILKFTFVLQDRTGLADAMEITMVILSMLMLCRSVTDLFQLFRKFFRHVCGCFRQDDDGGGGGSDDITSKKRKELSGIFSGLLPQPEANGGEQYQEETDDDTINTGGKEETDGRSFADLVHGQPGSLSL